jgi:hypothetical protein
MGIFKDRKKACSASSTMTRSLEKWATPAASVSANSMRRLYKNVAGLVIEVMMVFFVSGSK